MNITIRGSSHPDRLSLKRHTQETFDALRSKGRYPQKVIIDNNYHHQSSKANNMANKMSGCERQSTKSENSSTLNQSTKERNSKHRLQINGCNKTQISNQNTHNQRKRSGSSLHLAVMFSLLATACLLSPCTEATQAQESLSARVSQAAGLLQGIKGAGRLAHKLDLAKSGGQLSEWMVQQVAPAVATKIIDNVLHAPNSANSKKSSKSADSPIDTQALADKIVDKLADSIKKKKRQMKTNDDSASKSTTRSAVATNEESEKPAKSSSRRGKSLVSDSVHHVVQNLFAKDNRKLFGRAMEKSKLPFRLGSLHGNQQQQQHHQQHQQQQQQQLNNNNNFASQQHGNNHNYHNQSNSWMRVTEPVYDQHLFVSTDSSQLDENPVVLRAEHGHNLTTISPPPLQDQYNSQPLISSLMSSSTTNQMSQKLLQKHRLQQKYVHTNRHQQQHLSPKPVYLSTSNGRRQFPAHTQSPYSLSVTSDMNIVQAPSSPAPPQTQPPTTPSTTTTTTTMATTTPQALVAPFSFVPHLTTSGSNNHQMQVTATQATVTQLGPNKFKFNNRHQQPPNSVTLPGAPSSWFSSNRPQQHQQHPYHMPTNQHHRLHNQHHHSPTTTSTTTTTTTTSTTTPEPTPPQTEPVMTETLEPLSDMDQSSSSLGSSIIGAALESFANHATSQSSQSGDSNNEYAVFSPNITTSYASTSERPQSQSVSSPSSSSTKGGAASPSTTTARHSIISAEAIPTALGAPLYHLTRANFTTTSLMDPPPRRVGDSPVSKMAVQYFQKGLNSLSTNIFSRQSKNLARRLGLGSLIFGLLYGATVLSNPNLPMPASGLELFQMLTKNKRRRGSSASLIPPVGDANKQQQNQQLQQFAIPTFPLSNINPAYLDNNMLNLLYQQPQLIPVLEQILLQEQQLHRQQQQSSVFSQRSSASSPIEIENFDQDQASRRNNNPSQIYTIRALPSTVGPSNLINYGDAFMAQTHLRRRK